ncbi:nuclear transport factor 2 family protein [Sphingosinicella sp. CPCC 101087]|uniref:nuclear transport factor 2 family protein n=1 Tax=Sphingosinicella sp. CPCC 101087 TaxID=2497754 RepID=UPI001FB057B3|nr:nuclear transport factor 2 family protein [Sphingosinicella sp. CPCC 101087]
MIATAPGAAAGAGPAEEERNRMVVAQGFEAWRTGTGSPYDLLAPDASWTITGNSLAARTYPTREAFIREIIRPFNARMKSRLVPSVRKLYAEGDTVIAFFDAVGMARDDRPYANTYAWILEMERGQIVRAYAFFDSIAFDDLWRRVQPVQAGAPEP